MAQATERRIFPLRRTEEEAVGELRKDPVLYSQYSQVKGEKGKDFTYRDLKKVYVIVIFEKSEGIFHLVALDVFRKTMYSKGAEVNERNGWLAFLSVEDVDEAEALRILDRNTVQYMIDEQRKEIEQLRNAMDQQKMKEKQLESENEQLKKRLAEYEQ